MSKEITTPKEKSPLELMELLLSVIIEDASLLPYAFGLCVILSWSHERYNKRYMPLLLSESEINIGKETLLRFKPLDAPERGYWFPSSELEPRVEFLKMIIADLKSK